MVQFGRRADAHESVFDLERARQCRAYRHGTAGKDTVCDLEADTWRFHAGATEALVAVLNLPEVVEIAVSRHDRKTRLPGLLVMAYFYLGERYYYGTTIGVSNADGVVRVSREQIQSAFDLERVQFPMDLKVPLRDCDPVVEIRVEGGTEFVEHRAAVENYSLTRNEVRELFARARNPEVQTSSLFVPLAGDASSFLRVDLEVPTVL